MAHQLKQFNPPIGKGGRPCVYPWSKWLNGKTWELTRGKDFAGKVTTMAKLVRKTALKQRRSITAYIINDSKIVVCARNSLRSYSRPTT